MQAVCKLVGAFLYFGICPYRKSMGAAMFGNTFQEYRIRYDESIYSGNKAVIYIQVMESEESQNMV